MITSIETALVVDDDILMREFIIETLMRNGITVTQAGDGLEAKRMLDVCDYDLAFIDLKMPGMNGMDLLHLMKKNGVGTLVVMVTAFGTVEQAVDAMKIGAYDFLMKPFSPEQVELIIKRARELVGLQARHEYLKEELGWRLPGGNEIIGQSLSVKSLMRNIAQMAKASSTVLISGESGTGKELVALALHSMSDRSKKPFIRMNCAAVPDALIDSELFGHEKGAFTSAMSRRLGRFELADGGTLLLDEISEMKFSLQAKLLRVLQEQVFERVGGTRSIHTNCRVICSTNVNMRECVDQGKFRQDLFFRLNILPIHVAPLRERIEDIDLLTKTFLARNRPDEKICFNEDALSLMRSYSWPGNVRELKNLVERLCVMEDGPELTPEMLPAEFHDNAQFRRPNVVDVAVNNDVPILTLADIEKETIVRTLGIAGSRQKTADLLGISIRTLRNKLNQYKEEGIMPAA